MGVSKQVIPSNTPQFITVTYNELLKEVRLEFDYGNVGNNVVLTPTQARQLQRALKRIEETT